MEETVQDNGKYLGSEKLGTLLKKFAIPCVCSLIISCLYNIVDQIFVGNGVGYLGNAATGVIFPITVVGWGLSLLFGDGAANALSISMGRGENDKIHKIVGNALLFCFISGCLLIAISYAWGDNLLRLVGATDDNIELARTYGNIIFAMIPIAITQNAMAAIIRADGSPNYSLVAMLIGCGLNVIGDPLAIFVFKWGIAGAAYATIFGQFVSFIFCLLYFRKSKTFKLRAESFKPDFKLVKQVSSMGTGSFFTQLTIVVITIINNLQLVRYGAQSIYGADIPLSAFVCISKYYQILLNVAIGIAAGAQPIIGYNYGAGKYDRVKKLFKMTLMWTAGICLVCTLFFEVLPRPLIAIFGSEGDLYMDFAIKCLRVYLMLIVFTCLQKVCAFFMQSIGKVKLAAPLSMARDILLVIGALALPLSLGVDGVFWAAPVADLIAMIITVIPVIKVNKELSEGKAAAESDATIKTSVAGPVIAISREHGTAGKQIGRMVAEQLGIPLYYKEVLGIAAKESGISEEFISAINSNENAGKGYLKTDAVKMAVAASERTIKEIAKQGSCVIIGRAADYALKDNDNVIRVFIHAPKDFRIENVKEMYGDTHEEAVKNIEKSDKNRAAYYENATGLKWGDARNYDLCLDASMGREVCVKLIKSVIA